MGRAPKHCSISTADGICKTLVSPPHKHCPEHSGWNRSPRTASAKRTGTRRFNQRTRARILARDNHQCQLAYSGICTGHADTVDHIVPVADGGTDNDENLKAACTPCHRRRTAIDAAHRRHNTDPLTPRPSAPVNLDAPINIPKPIIIDTT